MGNFAAEHAPDTAGAEDADVVDLVLRLRIHGVSFRFFVSRPHSWEQEC